MTPEQIRIAIVGALSFLSGWFSYRAYLGFKLWSRRRAFDKQLKAQTQAISPGRLSGVRGRT